ncbi:MAG: cell division protein FtsZ [Candidatus Paracaedibacteraceae bacterium]|nr:cell division protein FtsZ [Candidatus Paracaedibacteraceae bacterium]
MTKAVVEPIVESDLRPRISVIGVGGAGGNAVNNMIRAKLEGVDFIIANTDAQAVDQSLVEPHRRLQLGLNITQGLGAGSKPDVGRASAEESLDEIISLIQGSNMVFITAGMGGGTGTGAAPVIARAARESGILTVGVVTKPFNFEGTHRMRSAEKGIEELHQYVDTLIIIPNQNLFRLANERTTFADAFKMADDVLYSGVRGVTDLMIMPGLINLDFADVRSVMAEMGKAMMGTGEAEGERRALDAAEAAISNPLLDDVSVKGAKGVLINITGGYDMTLYEVDEAANRIREDVESEANIIFGSTFDEKLNGRIRVSVVATGIGQQGTAAWRATATTATLPSSAYESASSSSMRSTSVQAPAMAGINHTYSSIAGQSANLYTDSNMSEFSEPAPTSPSAFVDNSQASDDLNVSSHTQSTSSEIERSVDFNSDSNMEPFVGNDLSSEQREPLIDQKAARRSPSLFERFTGVSRNRAQPQPVTEQVIKNVPNRAEDDSSSVLDIPAFLRRGNN